MTTEVSGVAERRSTNKNGYNSSSHIDKGTMSSLRRGGGGGKRQRGGGETDRQTDRHRHMEKYKQKDKVQHSKLNTEALANNGVIKPIVRPNIHDKTDLGK